MRIREDIQDSGSLLHRERTNTFIREAAQDYLKNPEDFKQMACKDLDKPLS